MQIFYTMRFLALLLLVPVVLSFGPTAYANHQSAPFTWPNGSFLKLSSRMYHGAQAQVGIVSNNCKFELRDMTQGYDLSRRNCTGPITDADDILLQYEDKTTWKNDPLHPGSTAGGVTFHRLASRDGWCGKMRTYDECGDHPVTIHLNVNKFCGDPCDFTKICDPAIPCLGQYYLDRGKQVQKYDLVRELMHELGHATGLADHCTSPAIMNDGTPSCKQPWFDGIEWSVRWRRALYVAEAVTP